MYEEEDIQFLSNESILLLIKEDDEEEAMSIDWNWNNTIPLGKAISLDTLHPIFPENLTGLSDFFENVPSTYIIREDTIIKGLEEDENSLIWNRHFYFLTLNNLIKNKFTILGSLDIDIFNIFLKNDYKVKNIIFFNTLVNRHSYQLISLNTNDIFLKMSNEEFGLNFFEDLTSKSLIIKSQYSNEPYLKTTKFSFLLFSSLNFYLDIKIVDFYVYYFYSLFFGNFFSEDIDFLLDIKNQYKSDNLLNSIKDLDYLTPDTDNIHSLDFWENLNVEDALYHLESIEKLKEVRVFLMYKNYKFFSYDTLSFLEFWWNDVFVYLSKCYDWKFNYNILKKSNNKILLFNNSKLNIKNYPYIHCFLLIKFWYHQKNFWKFCKNSFDDFALFSLEERQDLLKFLKTKNINSSSFLNLKYNSVNIKSRHIITWDPDTDTVELMLGENEVNVLDNSLLDGAIDSLFLKKRPSFIED